jgi:hypothetical protein
LFNYLQQIQARIYKLDTADHGIYKVQRDTRQSDINGVFNCTITPVVACAQQVGSLPQLTQAIAIAGDDGSTQFVKVDGQTKWQGYVVYWLAPSAAGVGLDLMRSFQGIQFQFINNVPQFQTADAVTAVTAAIAQASPSVAAPDVRQLLSSVTPADGIVALRMVAGVNRGDITGITLNGNTYARN